MSYTVQEGNPEWRICFLSVKKIILEFSEIEIPKHG